MEYYILNNSEHSFQNYGNQTGLINIEITTSSQLLHHPTPLPTVYLTLRWLVTGIKDGKLIFDLKYDTDFKIKSCSDYDVDERSIEIIINDSFENLTDSTSKYFKNKVDLSKDKSKELGLEIMVFLTRLGFY